MEYCKIIEKLAVDISSIKLIFANNEFTIEYIQALCHSLRDRELKKFGISLSGCGLSKESSMYLFDWLQYGIFVEDSIELDFSVYTKNNLGTSWRKKRNLL